MNTRQQNQGTEYLLLSREYLSRYLDSPQAQLGKLSWRKSQQMGRGEQGGALPWTGEFAKGDSQPQNAKFLPGLLFLVCFSIPRCRPPPFTLCLHTRKRFIALQDSTPGTNKEAKKKTNACSDNATQGLTSRKISTNSTLSSGTLCDLTFSGEKSRIKI